MRNDNKSYVMNFTVISMSIVLFGMVLLGFISLSIAQNDPWTAKKDMPTARFWFSSSVVDDKIYAIGGVAVEGPAFSIVEVYDPNTDSWDTTRADMPTPRCGSTSSVVGGKIYVIGGDSTFTLGAIYANNILEIYDPVTDKWDTTKTDMPTKRAQASASVVNDTIYVIGGANDTGPLKTVEAYDPKTNTWTKKMNMHTERYALSTCVVEGKIYAMGGFKPQNLQTVEEYDPKTDTWTTKKPMPIKNGYFGACVVDSFIFTVGGTAAGLGYYKKVYSYDPATDSWDTTKTDMPAARAYLCASVVNKKVYAIGGGTGWPPTAYSTVEEYDPALDPPTSIEHFLAGYPKAFLLHQNYPNPFNPSTTIEFDLPKTSEVTLKVFNILGEEVATLVSDRLTTGSYSYGWDAGRLASGVYLYRLAAGDYVETRRMLLMK
jgi:N-acetylneuraminic acid mutarotase